MTTTVTAQIQLRRDTAANWTSQNPILASGEIGYEVDTLKQKIGDGTTSWSSLDYYYDPSGLVTDHGALTGLSEDDHSQYHTDARGDARYSALGHNHDGTYEPADAAIQSHLSDVANPHSVTAAQVGADVAGTASGLMATHEAGTGVHSIAGVNGLQTALDGKSATTHDHAATYAPIAKGVTNGDAHDHAGGDGAQIAYSGLSGLPTLGSAAATDSTAYEAAGAIATHAALTTTHGISSFGATLVDDSDAATARSTLGLGSAATTASTNYATAAQGSTADTAIQPGDDAANLGSASATDGYVLTADGVGGSAWEVASTGTVTSIAVSGSDGIEVDSGSPITSSGTIALGVNASTLQSHLGLGTAAYTASTAYATTTQGGKADTAVQPGGALGTPSSGTLTNCSGYPIPTVKLDDAGAPDDNTDLNATTSAHGLLPKLGGGTSNYLRADGTWSTPSGSGYVASDTHAATSKTTPVDADELPLADSAASYVLKKLTWSNLKATLQAVFAPFSLTLNDQTGTTYTLVLSDAGKLIRASNAAAITLTVPPNSSVAFPTGTSIAVQQQGVGQVSIAAGAGVTINSRSSMLKISARYGGVSLVKTASDTWWLEGALSTW